MMRKTYHLQNNHLAQFCLNIAWILNKYRSGLISTLSLGAADDTDTDKAADTDACADDAADDADSDGTDEAVQGSLKKGIWPQLSRRGFSLFCSTDHLSDWLKVNTNLC